MSGRELLCFILFTPSYFFFIQAQSFELMPGTARFTPKLFSKEGKLYSSLELFSNLNREGHTASVQRLRVGYDIKGKGNQVGIALNLAQTGSDFANRDVNPGIFIRKKF